MRKINDESISWYHVNQNVGLKFGRLTIISFAYKLKGKCFYNCICDCGTERVNQISTLKIGHTKSCGCLNIEQAKIGAKKKFKKHGTANTRLYKCWKDAKNRCTKIKNAHYSDYGGRGIIMCDEWLCDCMAFQSWALLNGYTDKLTLERKDVNGNYCPENCTWIAKGDQVHNQRKTLFIEYNGERLSAAQWGHRLGSPSLVSDRIRRGWEKIKAITKPNLNNEKKGINI